MSPGSSTESYPAFARIGLRENPGKNLNQVTCPDRDSNPGHLVSQPDSLTVTPQLTIVILIPYSLEVEEIMLTPEQQVELVLLCGDNHRTREVADEFHRRHPDIPKLSHQNAAKLLHKFKTPFTLHKTNCFDGEITAISESLRNLLCHINKFKNAVILSDSKAAILSIVSRHTPSSQIAQINKMLSQLITLNKRIVFQWIPSHCGILGNENGDALAKKGSTATYRSVTKSTYSSVKRFIKSVHLDFNKQNLITQSQGKKWNSLHHNPQLIPDLPRKSSVAAFRLATGYDCLAKHLHRIGIYQSPNCPLCNSNQEMDSEHLKICASVANHDNIFEKYWSARGQMTLFSPSGASATAKQQTIPTKESVTLNISSRPIASFVIGILKMRLNDMKVNAGEMSPGSSTESYPAFARIGLRENPRKNLNQVTCPDQDSNPGHLVSQPEVRSYDDVGCHGNFHANLHSALLALCCQLGTAGFVKEHVFQTESTSIDDLKQRIINVFQNIPPAIILNMTVVCQDRVRHCLQVNGAHFEDLR
ncbi:hypothetical protein ANN_27185 [Periplaneta americana]|uniref:RNase H type-1 domain-containing protein n=1 Tax=Periplaneta americana TaxID=6978 RepID=A0ABQ8RXB6_PERAM|nr:hypothetical protein ANN_27185 [Periplaneta americana]